MWKLATASLSVISKDNTTSIQLFPAGWFGRADGSERWYLDAELAQVLIEAAMLRQNDYLFDYEHQSLYAAKASGPVPAAGWFSALRWVEGEGLFADVKWNQRAKELIQADEYRYVSPTFRHDEQGHVRELVNAALTNMPVLDGMRQVAASLTFFDNDEDPQMEELLEQLRWILNLPLSATQEDIKIELKKLIDRLSSGEGTTAASVNLLELLTQKDQLIEESQNRITALSATQNADAQPDPEKWVPVAVADELRNKLAQLSETAGENRIDKLLTAALSDGRVIAGADESYLRELGEKDFPLMERMIGSRKAIRALSALQSEGMDFSEKNKRNEPDAAALAICSQFGHDYKDVCGENQ